VLFGIIGGLGNGKTLSATYLTFDHWFQRREKIFANYHLFKIPYYYIDTIDKIHFASDGWFSADELWRIINSRTPMMKKNQFVYDILGKSRKKSVTWTFTTQVLTSIDKNVRSVLDFVSSPQMGVDDGSCLINIFVGNKASAQTHMKTVRFITKPFFNMYDTDEIIDMDFDSEGNGDKEPLLIFQPYYNKEHGYLCECEECGTKFFKDWSEADSFSEAWWNKNVLTVFPNMRTAKR
jgi:hypothetical protein